MTRHFNTFDQYSEYYNEHEHRANDVDIVEYDGAKKPHTDADGEFTCKNRQTAIKRRPPAGSGFLSKQNAPCSLRTFPPTATA